MLGICVRNLPCTRHVKRLWTFNLQIICATYDFVIWIAPTEEIRVFVLELMCKFKKKIENYYLSQLNNTLSDVRLEPLLCW